MNTYRNFAQPPQRSPHANQARRGPGPMPHQMQPAQPNPAQLQHQAALEAQRREMARRQSRKPTDRNLPDELDDITIGDGPTLYAKLRDAERRLDAVMMRKRLDVQNSTHRHSKRWRTMRIWISNTVDNQPWQQNALDPDAFDFTSESQGSYRVRVEGKLLPEKDEEQDDAEEKDAEDGDAMDTDGDKPAAPKTSKQGQSQRTKMSHFFKRINVDIDRSKSLQPEGFQAIEWKGPNADLKPQDKNNRPFQISAKPEHNFDSLDFERKGDENLNITINLYIDEYPERFKLSPELAAVLDTDEDERSGVVMGIWNYIKANNLQDEEDTRLVHCDAALKTVFKTEVIFFPQIPDKLLPHISSLPPLKLAYTIRVDKEFQSHPSPTIYDIQVPLEEPLHSSLQKITSSPKYAPTLQTIASIDDALAHAVAALTDAKTKHSFFNKLGTDPVSFLNRWVSSQRRDLEVILGEREEGLRSGEEWRLSGETSVWNSDIAKQSVGLWLANRQS